MCLGELGCPNLDYVYDMPWREYLIRLYAYKRQQKRLDYRQRDIMYQMYVGSWQDSKKKPLPIGRYWDIDGSEKKKRDRRMDALAKARAEYLKQKNG